MLLAIDIGNTTISIGMIRKTHKPWDPEIISVEPIETTLSPAALQKKIKQRLAALIRRYHVQDIVICSVVPAALKILKRILREDFKIKPMVVGEDILVPMKNHYRNPSQVGQDRLVCSFAGRQLYGGPLIVIDFGTAITFDVVSKKGEYLGGIILPGIRLTAESLSKKTALLPKVKIKTPRELIGRDTKSSILSGIFYGFGALCDGLIVLISKELKCRPEIIATGGYSHWMKKFISQNPLRVDPRLVFKGMHFLLALPNSGCQPFCVSRRGKKT